MNLTEMKIKMRFAQPLDITKLAHEASLSSEKVFVQKGKARVDAKSILGIFTLGLNNGDEIVVSSEDEAVLERIKKVIGTK